MKKLKIYYRVTNENQITSFDFDKLNEAQEFLENIKKGWAQNKLVDKSTSLKWKRWGAKYFIQKVIVENI